jgi:hypothetical protein
MRPMPKRWHLQNNWQECTELTWNMQCLVEAACILLRDLYTPNLNLRSGSSPHPGGAHREPVRGRRGDPYHPAKMPTISKLEEPPKRNKNPDYYWAIAHSRPGMTANRVVLP